MNTRNENLRAQIIALLTEKDGAAMSIQHVAEALNSGVASIRHTLETLVTIGVAQQRKTAIGGPGYHIPNAEQRAAIDARINKHRGQPLKPRTQYNEAVARALAERSAYPSLG